ncbi:MAG: hypothetical protein A2Z75_03490 [Chloroflexi bacterium RBG_13_50_10]|nr:MAG: hypothetical protein A2Z75_03490 [Chloroflexi bacterium RBG_13_50_10]
MKEQLRAMEAYLKELKALKRYKEAERLKEEVRQLKESLSELKSKTGRLERESVLNTNVQQEACQLREELEQARQELSMLKEMKFIVNGEHTTLEEAACVFVKAKEAEIRDRAEKESKTLQEKFEAEAPELVYHRLLAILKQPQWPAEIAQIMEKKAEEKAQSKLDEEFQQRARVEALSRLEEIRKTEWRPFVEEKALRIARDLKTLAGELQGTWHLICDRCYKRVRAEIGPREIATLLRGEQVVECPACKDFNLPPASPVTPHKIEGSALEDLLETYLAGKGPPGNAAAKPSQKESHPSADWSPDETGSTTL